MRYLLNVSTGKPVEINMLEDGQPFIDLDEILRLYKEEVNENNRYKVYDIKSLINKIKVGEMYSKFYAQNDIPLGIEEDAFEVVEK